ncbi:MAG: hypothetical protein KO464_01045 [Candidatus Methanofastidiosum sp.]|nr:hypothetical protein [Methanofastidiosum sp.]
MKKKFSILITLLIFGSIFGVTSVFSDDLDLEIKDFIIDYFVTETGQIYNNNTRSKDGFLKDTYNDNAFILYIDGSLYSASGDYTTEADGREYVLDTEIMSDLIVYRKVYFPEDRNWIRYLEILHNPTSTLITVEVQIDTPDLGSSDYTRCVKTSSGDTFADVNDYWVVTDDELDGHSKSNPSLSHVWDGPGGADRIDYLSGLNDEEDRVNYYWYYVTVNPGQTVVLMHFGGFEMNNNNAIALAQDLYNYKDDKMKYDLQEINQIINWSPSRLAKAGNKPSLPIAQIIKILKGNQEN